MKFLGLLALISASLLAQDSLTQEGGYWVRTMSGSPVVPPHSRLTVSMRGSVLIKGGDSQPSFRVTQRVRARSEAEARQLLAPVLVSNPYGSTVTRLDVNPAFSPIVSTQLELTLPRQLSSVTVETLMGAVEAYDLDSTLDVSTAAGAIHVDRVRGAVVIRTGGGDIKIGKIGSTLRCVTGGGAILIENTGGEVSCETAGVDIDVKDSGGKLMLSTEGGNISVDRAGGSVDAHSAEGVIEVLHAAGIVTAATRGGSIQIGSARGVRAESAVGQVRLKGSSGPLRVSTAAGSILAELFSGLPFEDSSLISGAGDITVLIPSNFALSVMATNQSANGKRGIVSDFSEVRVRNAGLFQAPMLAQGSINGGGPMLTLNVAGGVIYLRKK
jgi:DUF4097 and DUF4098 domain-containing protein YvlB